MISSPFFHKSVLEGEFCPPPPHHHRVRTLVRTGQAPSYPGCQKPDIVFAASERVHWENCGHRNNTRDRGKQRRKGGVLQVCSEAIPVQAQVSTRQTKLLILLYLVQILCLWSVFTGVAVEFEPANLRWTRTKESTRSSAQGNCSAKSLAPVMSILHCSSILPYHPYLPPVMLSVGGGSSHGGVWMQGGSSGEGGWGRGGGLGGRGQGTFHPPCHILHHHMVLRPKGTLHNKHKSVQEHVCQGAAHEAEL